ncbi:hypothetical protein B7494_g4772, partial [Chlorociboria aeruginascens]
MSPNQEHRPPATEQKEAPPNYSANDPADGPSEAELTSAFSNLSIVEPPTQLPDADHCLAHLKLLTALHRLKEDVGYTDGLFGLWDARCEMAKARDASLAQMREKRWNLYVAKAVRRFEQWWLQVLCPMEKAERLETDEMHVANKRFTNFTQLGRMQKWTTNMLPPLDVLMVWHAFMLNPRTYLEDCIRFGVKDLWASGFPWRAVNTAIDTSFNYTVPDNGKAVFVAKTGYNWNNAEDSLTTKSLCPRCNNTLVVLWTTCGTSDKPSAEELNEMKGNGLGDRDFSYSCHKCGGAINHDLLRVSKFNNDALNLIQNHWPMGGTILSPKSGTPENKDADALFYNMFPNRLVGVHVARLVHDLVAKIHVDSSDNPTMNDVKKLIEKSIKDKSTVRKANNKSMLQRSTLMRGERLAIRKMMSRYWENSSIFAIELGGAVLRQGVFVEKMHDIDWLHSPAAQQTMERLLVKYTRFITIMTLNPDQVAVPTLDVDLGWHTHQLTPKTYFDYTTTKCQKFIDHNDKMEEDDLSKAFEWTSKTYEKLFHEVYSECTCWYCEAIRSRHIEQSSKIFGTSKHEKVLDKFYDSGNAKLCTPSNSAHVSSHPSVRTIQSDIRERVFAAKTLQRKRELDNAYKRAVQRAKAKGRRVPDRGDYYGSAWGYPYMMYGPYMAPIYGYGGVYYAGDPCTMAQGTGVVGSCAAGTCGGGVAAGACGGAGGCGGAGASGVGGCGGGGGGGGCGGG